MCILCDWWRYQDHVDASVCNLLSVYYARFLQKLWKADRGGTGSGNPRRHQNESLSSDGEWERKRKNSATYIRVNNVWRPSNPGRLRVTILFKFVNVIS